MIIICGNVIVDFQSGSSHIELGGVVRLKKKDMTREREGLSRKGQAKVIFKSRNQNVYMPVY